MKPKKTFRVASVMGTFDLQSEQVRERFTGDIDLPDNWQIGLIVGNSGTGKTTIARELFGDFYVEQYTYTHETILDDMPKDCSMEQIERTFNSVGFSSPPSWLKPYAVLSNGEKMRVDLARAILEDREMFVFDEFTSVVDRNVARIGSFAIQKAVRRTDRRFIAVTCHYDVEDWLLPDWVFDTNTMTLHVSECGKKKRPDIKFDTYEIKGTQEKRHYWNMFAKYHYLSSSFNDVARVYVCCVNDEIAVFSAILAFPHPTIKNIWKEHRTVVLPDYQGIGLSRHIANFIGERMQKQGKQYVTTTSNPARIEIARKDPNWIVTRFSRAQKPSRHMREKKKYFGSDTRITASLKYIGNTNKL